MRRVELAGTGKMRARYVRPSTHSSSAGSFAVRIAASYRAAASRFSMTSPSTSAPFVSSAKPVTVAVAGTVNQ